MINALRALRYGAENGLAVWLEKDKLSALPETVLDVSAFDGGPVYKWAEWAMVMETGKFHSWYDDLRKNLKKVNEHARREWFNTVKKLVSIGAVEYDVESGAVGAPTPLGELFLELVAENQDLREELDSIKSELRSAAEHRNYEGY